MQDLNVWLDTKLNILLAAAHDLHADATVRDWCSDFSSSGSKDNDYTPPSHLLAVCQQ